MAVLNGTNNADSLVGPSGESNDLFGFSGDDTLVGADFDDLINGGAGDDQIFAGSGNDTVTAAEGDDSVFSFGALGEVNRISLDAGDDQVFAGEGADLIDGGLGQDVANYDGSNAGVIVNLRLGQGVGGFAQGDTYRFVEDVVGSFQFGDFLIGNGVSNVLDGNGGDDRIRGGIGADFLIGGSGFDTLDYVGSWAGVTVSLLTGEATGGDALGDQFEAFEGVIGSDFADRLTGDRAGNRLSGGAGNDYLMGGAGADLLAGGLGADRFSYRTLGDSTFAVSGRDFILDFSVGGGDVIDLSAIDANTAATGNQAFAFRGAGAFTGAEGQVRFQQIGGSTFVYGDVNGDRTADLSIRLDGLLALTAGDFVL